MNSEISDQLDKLNDIYDNKNNKKSIKTASCSELIQKLQMDYKAMSYSLRRIVCSEEDSHIIITSSKDQLTDIVMETNMYFKVNVKNKTAPGRLLITYTAG